MFLFIDDDVAKFIDLLWFIPLALGMMAAYLGSYKDGVLLKRYNLLPIVAMTPAQRPQAPKSRSAVKMKGISLWASSE